MKKTALCVVISIVGIGVSGCSMKQKIIGPSENETVVTENASGIELTERQKSILESEGLPTEIEKLTYRQEKAIMGIEELLTYLEDKYDREFIFVDYSLPSTVSCETLRARVPEGDSKDNFDVRRIDGQIEDDYMNVAIRDDYAQYVQDLLVAGLGNDRIKVFAYIRVTTLMEIPSDKADYKGTVSSGNEIFIYLPDSGEEQMDACYEAIKKILEDEYVRGDSEVVFLREDTVNEITKYNYRDYFADDQSICGMEITVKSRGDI